jgi:hypothetical protein
MSYSKKEIQDFLHFNLPIGSEDYFSKGKSLAQKYSEICISANDEYFVSNTLCDVKAVEQINKEYFRGFLEGSSKIVIHRVDSSKNVFSSFEVYKEDGKVCCERITK